MSETGVSVSRRSNRNRRPARIEKAQTPGVGTGATVYTAAQVKALLQSTHLGGQVAGGFNPLPRLDPQVAFGPGLALIPAALDPIRQDTGRPEPRFNEYPVSANLPGVTDRLVPWKVLRDAASAGGIPRRCIDLRKSDVASLNWSISITKTAVAQAEADDPSASRASIEADLRKRLGPEIARCSTFWERPDPGQDEDWIEWISKLLEDHLVLDAVAIYPRMTYGGGLHSLEIIDSATIKVLRDYRGGRAGGGQAAYQQMLWGFPRGEYVADVDEDGTIRNGYSADTLIYKIRDKRSDSLYGHSAVEKCLEDLDTWLRRRAWIRAEYTDGAVPSGLLRNTMENSWTPAQVLEYETALNDAWSGQTLERHRLRILPPGFVLEQQADVAERYKPEYDLFLLKQLANHFSTTIAELNFTDSGGLGSSGYHEGQADIRERSATLPLYRWIQALITQISRRHLKMPPELEFRILGLEEEDEAAADAVAQARVQWARMTLNEDRDRLGLPRFEFPEADKPMIMTTRGVVFLEGAAKVAPPGETVGPVEAPPNTDANGDGIPDRLQAEDADGADDQQAEAAKSEVAAYRRWAKRSPRGTRPFRCTVLTKADAPADLTDDTRIVFATPGGDEPGPKAGDQPVHWPGWERDQATAQAWVPHITKALKGSVDARGVAERWLSEQLVKSDAATADPADYWTGGDAGSSDPWDVTAALAFLHRHGITVVPAMAFLRLVWLEGWAVGHASAVALLDGREHVDAWGWAEGDADAAGRTVQDREQFDQWARQSSIWATSIAAGRLKALAQALAAGGRAGDGAAQLSARIHRVLGDAAWARIVALTELTRGSSAGAVDTYRAAGVRYQRWQTSEGSTVCVRCSDFEEAGAIPLGEMWADDCDGPPAHTLCYCAVLPA